MRELEAKYAVRGNISSLCKDLGGSGFRFGRSTTQTDYVFATSAEIVLNPVPDSVVARVRVEDSHRVTLTVKRRRASELDRDEAEVVIDSPKQGKDALRMLGLQEVVTVKKFRRSSRLDQGTLVLLDDVEGLGVFIEVEVLGDDTSGAKERLEAAMARISRATQLEMQSINKGYDRLLIEGPGGTSRSSDNPSDTFPAARANTSSPSW